MRLTTFALAVLMACGGATLTGCASAPPTGAASAQARSIDTVSDRARNVIFFLGDGMGINTLTAARIYAVGEAGELTIDTLPESAFVKTYSNDAQVTDSAASMSAYMTGVKQNNGVISMSGDTMAIAPAADSPRRAAWPPASSPPPASPTPPRPQPMPTPATASCRTGSRR
jgi:alkaline phosphatase